MDLEIEGLAHNILIIRLLCSYYQDEAEFEFNR